MVREPHQHQTQRMEARRVTHVHSKSGLLLILRGGGENYNDDSSSTTNINDERQEEDALSKQVDSSDPEQKKSMISWLVGSLFDLPDDSKLSETAPLEQEAAGGSVVSSPPLSRPSASSSSLSQKTGRGGALVKEKSSMLRSRFKWLGPLDTSRVAPSAARLLRDEDSDDGGSSFRRRVSPQTDGIVSGAQQQSARTTSSIGSSSSRSTTSRITESVIASAQSVSRVWWVNTWAEQLPDDEDEELAIVNALQDDRVLTGDATDDTIADEQEDDEEEEEYADDDEDELLDVTILNVPIPAEATNDEMGDLDALVDEALSLAVRNETVAKAIFGAGSNVDIETEVGTPKTESAMQFESTLTIPLHANVSTVESLPAKSVSPYVSSGFVSTILDDLALPLLKILDRANFICRLVCIQWRSIDKLLTLGYADEHPVWRVSSHLRTFRKSAAKVTGLHGVLSGKPRQPSAGTVDDEQLGLVRRRLAAIDRARRNVERASAIASNSTVTRRLLFWKVREPAETGNQYAFVLRKSSKEKLEEERRKDRVREIDKQMHEAQQRLMQLACEKDVLQRRPNPLWNYTTTDTSPDAVKNESRASSAHDGSVAASRQFNFPHPDLVSEYLDMLFASGRLVKLNHTDIWRNGNVDEYDDEDELALPMQREEDRKQRNGNGGSGGSWLLRNGLGEKIGETTETAAYKAVCSALMSVLARSISSLHGVNVMTYSDIRLSTEQAPDLPPISAGIIPGSSQNRNYAHEAFQDAMRRGAKKRRANKRRDNFIQRDAVVETLTSQCQIAAPLLKLFPLAWQRAMLGNIVTMSTAIIADFCEGIEFQILGHRLSFAFTPITEEDMIRGMVRDSFNNPRRTNPEQFEAAVRATAEEVGENLKFLDRWHERALGSGMLRTQIATLIARLVLTLTDDTLCGSRIDLWAAHAGGPRLLAALEYRTTPSYMDEAGRQQ